MTDPLIASYNFLSWCRRGIAGLIETPDPLIGELPLVRAEIHAHLKVQASLSGTAVKLIDAAVDGQVLGPGDVIGFDSRHVLKTEPRHLTANFEPNYFAAIEFDDPDLPWMFTPARPSTDNRLRPWLCLLALKPTEFKPAGAPATLPVITVTEPKALPNLDESWAWAHVQVSGPLPAEGLGALIETQPEAIISRLVCPRRLEPETAYTAFLVPAFDVGRLAGKSGKPETANTLTLAWNAATHANLDLPIYYQFEFHTSDQGDFESLVRQLQPRTMPETVGVRPIEVDQPGWSLPSAGPPILLGGALQTPSDRADDWQDPARAAFVNDLTQLINQTSPTIDDPLQPAPLTPKVVPPIYGRWHAGVERADGAAPRWLQDLNLDPRRRVAAGLGTEVVVADRVALMAAAWRQVAGIQKANQLIRQAHLAREVLGRVSGKHLRSLSDAQLLTLTSGVHSRVRASPTTVRSLIATTRAPTLAFSGAFRRVSRVRGPLRRRQRSAAVPSRLIAQLATGEASPLPALHSPRGMVGLDQISATLVPASIPGWLRPLLPSLDLLILVLALLVAALLLVIGVTFGAILVGVALASLTVAGGVALIARERTLIERAHIASRLTFGNLEPTRFKTSMIDLRFQLRSARMSQTAAVSSGDIERDRADFGRAASAVAAFAHAPAADPPQAPVLDMRPVAKALLERLDPERTVAERVIAQIEIDRAIVPSVSDDPLAEIMAAPEFPQPMYLPLRDRSQDYLLPGLSDIPPDTITLLRTERAFIEAYMVGLNHEMARQLLWHEYPTDQRGSYFRQFWDVSGYVPPPNVTLTTDQLAEALKDIPPIHAWKRRNVLGKNENPGPEPAVADGLVLLLRGELLRRYPNAIIYATPAKWDQDGVRGLGDTEMHPLFRGTLSPDITFFGFNLEQATAMGSDQVGDGKPGWFFVIQQHISEPRFGLEPAKWSSGVAPTVKEWNDLSWANFATDATALAQLAFAPATAQPTNLAIADQKDDDGVVVNPGDLQMAWAKDAAQTAFITLRRPVRVAVHASVMLKAATTVGATNARDAVGARA